MTFGIAPIFMKRTTLFDPDNKFSRPKFFLMNTACYMLAGTLAARTFEGKPWNYLAAFTIAGLVQSAIGSAVVNEAKTNSWDNNQLRSRMTLWDTACDSALWISMWAIPALKINPTGMGISGGLLAGDLLLSIYDANRVCCKDEQPFEDIQGSRNAIPSYSTPSERTEAGGGVVVHINTNGNEAQPGSAQSV